MMINTREIAEEYRLTHWAQVMQERSQSGLTIKAFCRQIGICTNTYFYWQRRLRQAAFEQMEGIQAVNVPASLPAPRFSEVRIEETPEHYVQPKELCPSRIHIEIGVIKITADNAYPPDKLAALLRELSRPC